MNNPFKRVPYDATSITIQNFRDGTQIQVCTQTADQAIVVYNWLKQTEAKTAAPTNR